MREAIGAAIIEGGKILLVKKKNSWILPGGKANFGESDIDCLEREIFEELSGTKLENITYYKDFFGLSPHFGDIIKVKVYFAKIKGDLYKPSLEISASEWTKDLNKYNLSDVTSKIIESLKTDKYLN